MQTWPYKTQDEFYFEEATRFLVENMPREASDKKPVLLHCIRVWNYLIQKWYSRDVVIAWYLHDIIEDSQVSPESISSIFGQNVLEIVLANSKNPNIEKENILQDMVARCHVYWKDAMIVKSADVIDNYHFYKKIWAESEVERTIFQARLILSYLDALDIDSDIIFQELFNIQK